MVLVTFKLTLIKVDHQQMAERMHRLKQNTAFSEGTETRHYSTLGAVKSLPAMWETGLPSLGGEDPLEKGMVWRIPWTEEHGRLQSMGSHRIGDD